MEENQKQQTIYTFKPTMSGSKPELMIILGYIIFSVYIMFLPKPLFIKDLIKKIFLQHANNFYYIIGGILLFIGFCKFIKLKFRLNNTTYKLSTERLSIQTGIFSKKISNLELWRVNDVELRQNVAETSFGTCTIILMTQDTSDPIIFISNIEIEHGRRIFEVLNSYVNNSIKNGKSIIRTV